MFLATLKDKIKEVLIMPMIEAEDKLVQIGLKVSYGDAMIHTEYCPRDGQTAPCLSQETWYGI